MKNFFFDFNLRPHFLDADPKFAQALDGIHAANQSAHGLK
jgi:hypothetical protein